MRLFVKRAVEFGLSRSGLASLVRRFHRHDVLVLAYHNVVPEGATFRGDRSLHVGQEQFHRQLSLLSQTHQFITVDQIHHRGIGKPRIVVTFDDAYRGAVQLGVEVLRDLNVPATIFVPPGCLGGQQFWWDVLSCGPELDPGVREFVLSELRGNAPAIFAWANREPDRRGVPAHVLTATEAELDTALTFDGLTFGSHTWSHPNLVTLGETELVEELVRPLDWLRARYPHRTAEWLSYPYGRWSNNVAVVARRAGYRGAFRIDGGWTPADCDPYGMPRLNVSAGLSVEGLALRSSGLMGRGW